MVFISYGSQASNGVWAWWEPTCNGDWTGYYPLCAWSNEGWGTGSHQREFEDASHVIYHPHHLIRLTVNIGRWSGWLKSGWPGDRNFWPYRSDPVCFSQMKAFMDHRNIHPVCPIATSCLKVGWRHALSSEDRFLLLILLVIVQARP